ncbi:MAG: hypothetical protein ABL884_12380 [Methyloglobulus sp.]
MLLVELWHGGLSDEAVEDITNVNLHVSRFPGLRLEDEVPRPFGVVAAQDAADQGACVGRVAGGNQPAN